MIPPTTWLLNQSGWTLKKKKKQPCFCRCLLETEINTQTKELDGTESQNHLEKYFKQRRTRTCYKSFRGFYIFLQTLHLNTLSQVCYVTISKLCILIVGKVFVKGRPAYCRTEIPNVAPRGAGTCFLAPI